MKNISMFRMIAMIVLLCPISHSYDPQKLLSDWQICQFEQSTNLNCDDLRPQIQILNNNVDLMQSNPQQMGLSIMNLQVQLSKDLSFEQRTTLEKDLQEKWATVGWLESPK